jgi:hypothetical protein
MRNLRCNPPRNPAHNPRSSVAQRRAQCRPQPAYKLCAMPRAIRSTAAVQSVRTVAHNLLRNAALKSYNRMQWSQLKSRRYRNRH